MDTILVLDDDRTFTSLLKTVFEMEGYRAVALSQPDDVIPAARQINPALVLMDVHAGQGDTLGIVRALRADVATETVPVLMTSGMDHRAECLEAGANAFILKPFRPVELLAVVKKVLGNRDADL